MPSFFLFSVADGNQHSTGWIPGYVDPHRAAERLPGVAREDPEAQEELRGRLQTHKSTPPASNQKVSNPIYREIRVFQVSDISVRFSICYSLGLPCIFDGL